MSNLVIIMKNKIIPNFLTLAFWSTHTFPFEINIYENTIYSFIQHLQVFTDHYRLYNFIFKSFYRYTCCHSILIDLMAGARKSFSNRFIFFPLLPNRKILFCVKNDIQNVLFLNCKALFIISCNTLKLSSFLLKYNKMIDSIFDSSSGNK